MKGSVLLSLYFITTFFCMNTEYYTKSVCWLLSVSKPFALRVDMIYDGMIPLIKKLNVIRVLF